MTIDSASLTSQQIAAGLGIPSDLLPWYPELLADIWILGSWPDRIVELLRLLQLPAGTTRVLEVGCGKGAVSIAVAGALGCFTRGVDQYEPFIQEAIAQAHQAGVADRCLFELADMRAVLDTGGDYDILIFAAIGNVLGDFRHTVARLRQAVRAGGYMVIDDGFLSRRNRLDRPGYEHYRPHDETLCELTAHGDVLLREVIVPLPELKAYNQNNMALIETRAASLIRVYPELSELFDQFLRAEEEECRLLEEETVPAVWLLQRG